MFLNMCTVPARMLAEGFAEGVSFTEGLRKLRGLIQEVLCFLP